MDQIFASIADPEQDVIAPRQLLFDVKVKDGSVRLLLLAMTLLLNPKWQLTQTGLATLMKRSRRQVQKYVANLKRAGYLRIDKHRDSKGRWDGWSWTIYRRGLMVQVKSRELPIFRTGNVANLH